MENLPFEATICDKCGMPRSPLKATIKNGKREITTKCMGCGDKRTFITGTEQRLKETVCQMRI